ncbi:MAG: septum formation protein Maf [Clostridia bacterium]|nr:septum formation protein Maf [Clostridia bacterium]
MMNVILASASPRRREILALAGIGFRVMVPPASLADESAVVPIPSDPAKTVRDLAEMKSRAALRAFGDSEEVRDSLILAADTVVWLPGGGPDGLGEILGKPKDAADAVRMLKELSGRSHRVFTGVALVHPASGRRSVFSEETEVFFRPLGDGEIRRYVESGDPLDKAGSYGYQSGACIFVESIRGDYFNVVGLPICRVSVEIGKMEGNGMS